MKKLLFSAVLMTVLLLTASVQEVAAQSAQKQKNVQELETKLKGLTPGSPEYKAVKAEYKQVMQEQSNLEPEAVRTKEGDVMRSHPANTPNNRAAMQIATKPASKTADSNTPVASPNTKEASKLPKRVQPSNANVSIKHPNGLAAKQIKEGTPIAIAKDMKEYNAIKTGDKK